MSTIEQAAKRLEELRRAGVNVPAISEAVGTPSPALRADAPPVAAPAAAPVSSALPDTETVADRAERRSREVNLDLAAMSKARLLVPGAPRTKEEDEFRIIKRPLLENAKGQSAAPIARGNLIMVTS